MRLDDLAIGVDIGGTSIKAALVDTGAGALASESVSAPTPAGAEPSDVLAQVGGLVDRIGGARDGIPIGVCYPGIVLGETTMWGANMSEAWIGLPAADVIAGDLGTRPAIINDADAAGLAEARFGAARDVRGLVVVTTLGTGIGTAFLHDGTLLPNTDLGHLRIEGGEAEALAAYSVKLRDGLSWAAWAHRLTVFYRTLESLFSPALFVIGGGAAHEADRFMTLIDVATPLAVASHRNGAGIIGAAVLGAERRERS